MKSIVTLFLAVLAVAAPFCPAGAQERARHEVTTTPLGGSVSMLATGAGGNLAVCVGEDGVFLVDSEYTELAGLVRDAVGELSEKPVSLLLNTHWHFDHVGGNQLFAEGGALIVAHENVRARMAKGQRIAVIDVDVPPSPEDALPAITFKDAITFRMNGEVIRVFHPGPAHTDGDSVVVFEKANVIHTGDIVFYPGYPFIDISASGSIDGVIAAVKGIEALCDDDTKIIPGHGPLMGKAELHEYLVMLQEFRAIIEGEIAAGKDLAAIIARRPTAELDAKWGGTIFPPDKFTEIVFRSLEGK